MCEPLSFPTRRSSDLVGTALAVLVAAWQLRRGTVQARTDFEDDLSREYRELARSISPDAHLGRELNAEEFEDRKSTRLNSSHGYISYAVFCLKKKNEQ